MPNNEINRDLENLVEPFKSKVKNFLADSRVSNIFVTEGYRSQERQEYLYKKIPRVTWTLNSMHTKGLAIDIAFKGQDIYPADINKWKIVSEVAKEYGIDWGYDLWGKDKPHFQNEPLKVIKGNKYTKILDQEILEGYIPVFNSLEGEGTLTEAEIKTLLEIGFARLEKRN